MAVQILKQNGQPFDGGEIRYSTFPNAEKTIGYCDNNGMIKSGDLAKLIGRQVQLLVNGNPHTVLIRDKVDYILQIGRGIQELNSLAI